MPGVFRRAIEFLLVLATPVQVYVIGVEFSGEPTLSGSVKGREINFDHDPLHTTATDNVVMSCIVGTDDGRVFMGGRDGSVYELLYEVSSLHFFCFQLTCFQRDDGWLFSRKCRKVNHTTSALSFLVPTLIKSLWSQQPVLQLCVDNSRRILYCRSATHVQVLTREAPDP